MLFARGAVADLPSAGHQNQARGIGVDGARNLWWHCDCRDQLARRQRRAAVVVGEQNRCHGDGFGDRAGYAPPAEPLRGDHQVDRVRLDAVELLRHRQRGDAEVGQLRPHLAAGRRVALGPCPHRGGQIGGPQRRVDAGGEVALLFVSLKIHSRIHLLVSRGSPSRRSAMMLR